MSDLADGSQCLLMTPLRDTESNGFDAGPEVFIQSFMLTPLLRFQINSSSSRNSIEQSGSFTPDPLYPESKVGEILLRLHPVPIQKSPRNESGEGL